MIVPLLLLAQTFNVGTLNVGQTVPGYPFTSIDIPRTIYALEGQTFALDFFNVVRYDSSYSQINYSVVCTKGTATATRWTYLPTAGDAGTVDFTLKVIYTATGGTISEKTSTLVTRPIAYPSTSVTNKLLIVGDSTTAGGFVSAQLTNLFIGDTKYTLVETGSNQGSQVDSNGVFRAVAMDGISGWTCGLFETNYTLGWIKCCVGIGARTGSPFVDPTTHLFSPSYYSSTWSVTLSDGDWIIFNLGINDIFAAQVSNAATDASIAFFLASFERMRTSLQSYFPGVRVGICLTIPPNQSSAVFTADYGPAPYTLALYQLANHKLVEAILARYDTDSSGVAIVPLNMNLDTVNNMQNGVHPNQNGYSQIASTYRMFLKGAE